ncbi:hypothetical protein E3N88_20743 [Mikania micrantha]|uniref:Uncharacterized protein n=1 Tax=Mikania micrantha TaxID=192012 RepID=A0A5N6NJK2_9ASTR|nr:hypothetical protein E3N88_20743 [Mikania micrantha]
MVLRFAALGSELSAQLIPCSKRVILMLKIKKTSSRLVENKSKTQEDEFWKNTPVAYRDTHLKPCRVARQVEITILPLFNDYGFDPTILSGNGLCRVARRVTRYLSRSETGLKSQKIEFYVFETAGGALIRFWTIRDNLGGN